MIKEIKSTSLDGVYEILREVWWDYRGPYQELINKKEWNETVSLYNTSLFKFPNFEDFIEIDASTSSQFKSLL